MITKIFNINKVVSYDMREKDIISFKPSYILIEDDMIKNIGFDKTNDDNIDNLIDANNNILTPGFIDSHTHLIFSSNRSKDFSKRISGQSYIDIANSGGGIKSSIKSLREASDNQIIDKCMKEINNFIRSGTTTIEAKSGYGLSVPDEIRSLEIIKKLNQLSDIDLIPTFMGAHDFPEEVKDQNSYVDLICKEMIPEISSKKLAEFCDIFYEKGYFNKDQTIKIANQAVNYGLDMKLHADEFEDSDGAYLSAEINAVSADHLMHSNENGLKYMAEKEVVATILPGTTLFLGLNTYANGRKIIESGCSLAIASDYNPGSNTIYSLPIIIALSCLYCGLSINEALKAVTYNAAKALKREDSIGIINEGYNADILFWNIDDINEIPYWFGSDRLSYVMKKGQLIFQNNIN